MRGLAHAKIEATKLFLQNRKASRIVGAWRCFAAEKRSIKLGN